MEVCMRESVLIVAFTTYLCCFPDYKHDGLLCGLQYLNVFILFQLFSSCSRCRKACWPYFQKEYQLSGMDTEVVQTADSSG